MRVNETVWHLNLSKSVSFAAFWVVGHFPTLPCSRYPLPSQLLGCFCLFCNVRGRYGIGIALYINENLSPSCISNINITSDSVWVNIKGKYGYLIIGSIYRSPNSLAYHYDHIVNDFDLMSSFNYDLIIMGDYKL